MSWNDLVASCGDGNPLTQMVNHFTQDTAGQEKHELSFEEQQQLHEMLMREGNHDETLQFHGNDLEPFFNNEDPFDSLSYNPPSHNQHDPTLHIPPRFDGMLAQPPVNHLQAPHQNPQLQHLFKSFLDASTSQQNFSGQFPKMADIQLTPIAKEKIRNRLGNIARQLNPESPQIQNQVDSIVESLSSTTSTTFTDNVHEDWAQDFHSQQVGDRWARDFEARRHTGGFVDDWERGRFAQRKVYSSKDFNKFEKRWDQIEMENWVEDYQNVDQELLDKINYTRYLESLTPEEAEIEMRGMASRIAAAGDPKLRNSQFLDFMAKVGDGKLDMKEGKLVEEKGEEKMGEEEKGMTEELEEWVKEYPNFRYPGNLGRNGISNPFEGAWGDAISQNNMDARDMFGMGEDFEEFGMFADSWSRLGRYEFAEENPFLGDSRAFEKGKDLFSRGELSDAILAFEAAVRLEDVQQDIRQVSDSWRWLGESHAENDRDDRAIAALKQAVKVDEGNLDAMVALAVSCTNDSYRQQALHILKSWLRKNSKYSHLVGEDNDEEWLNEFNAGNDLHFQVTDLFIEAARLSPHDPDPDVQIALGLLFNLSQEYDKAVDCFRTALQKKPDDYLLWNKLGATLANSNRSKEALGPYYKSLSVKPTYTRARANLGISYLNLEMYEEASTQFLACLAIQPAAKHIWMNLQAVFSRMDRDDLLEKSLKYDVDLFRGDFDF
eukprot:TRINITY_DN2833_c0_g1_i1.p1 TRINITY_DN2833_c0_g1~~TRINITY_DN2833_c0_g1_i1.p1  ORF type:complete len:719 (-),score=204.25 TRINITY_DN2833_c0_g1_i1:23-2179(-)